MLPGALGLVWYGEGETPAPGLPVGPGVALAEGSRTENA
jgi:hypothetical protein